MSIKKNVIAAALTLCSLTSAVVFADSVTVTGNGSTFIINQNEGFDGADAEDRSAVFVAAVRVWADILVSEVDIVIDASFSSTLFCNANSATLGYAGPYTVYRSNAVDYGLQNNVWYPVALFNSYYGSDYYTGYADITATFNSDIGQSDCMASSGWYYGMDGNTPFGYIDFYEVVLHELGHGLGFLSLVNSDGSLDNGIEDIYSKFLRDQDSATNWTDMSDSQRAASMVDNGNLVWNGSEVDALAGTLTNGVNNGHVQMYAPGTYSSGSSISHFDTVLTPNELMEPQYTGDASYDHSIALLKDIGWNTYDAASVNDIPEITGQSPLSTNEDTSLELSVNDLTISDDDDSSFTLTVSSGTNYSVSGNRITPAANFNGTLTVPVTVNDGEDDSASFNLSVSVIAVNDVPQITGQDSLVVAEDSALTLQIADLTITDPDDSSFTLSVLSGTNYTVADTTVTPNANFYGTLTVPVSVNDGEANSDNFNLSVSVTSVNDRPSIIGQSTLSMAEDTSLTITVDHLTITDVDDSSFTLTLSDGDNYSVVGNVISPDLDYNGSLTVPVRVNDGETDSELYDLAVTVTAVNDAPVLSGSPATEILYSDNYSATFSAQDVDNTSLNFSVSSNHTWLTISNDGVLTGSPSTADIGTQAVTVTVDDGDLSDSVSFNLAVIDSTYADLATSVNLTNDYAPTNVVITAHVTVTNRGPAENAGGSVDVLLDNATSSATSDNRCSVSASNEWRCTFSNVGESTEFEFTLSASAASVVNVEASVNGSLNDAQANNNWADATVVIDGQPATPDNAVNFANDINTRDASFAAIAGEADVKIFTANDLTANEQQLTFDESYTVIDSTVNFAENSDANAVLTADVNNDELIDVLFASATGTYVYFQQNDGTWGNALMIDSNAANAIAVGHLNNDDAVDLVIATDTENMVYLNSASSQFNLHQRFGGSESKDIALIDYNEDGWSDVLVANANDDDYVYLNISNSQDQTSVIFDDSAILIGSVLTASQAIAVGDLDGDGATNDFAIARATAEGAASIAAYHVSNSVASELFSLDAGDLLSISIGDFDGDGEDDLAAVNDAGVVMLWTVVAGQATRLQSFQHSGANSVTLADVDADDYDDLSVLSQADSASVIYVSLQTGEATDEADTDTETTPDTDVDSSTDNTDTSSDDNSTSVSSGAGSLSWFALIYALILLQRRRSGEGV